MPCMTRHRPLLGTAVVLSASALLLGACSSPLPLPELLQLATAIPSATPTATPTPSPTPTPTPLPIVAVREGERHLANGDWDRAELSFLQVINDPGATIDERANAQIGLAESHLRRGAFTEAAAEIDRLLAANPATPRAAQAYFLRGDARSGLGDWAGAIADYQAYLAARPGLIDSYVYERIGDAQIALEQYDAGLASYEQAITAGRYLQAELRLREKVAQVYRTLVNAEGAVTQYQAILERAQNPGYRAQIELYIGQAYFEAGNQDAAYAQWEQVFANYPSTFEALSALRALLDAGYPVNQYQRGLVNYFNGQYDIAIEAFYNHLSSLPVDEYPPEAYLYIARSYRKLGNLQAAQTELQSMIDFFDPEDSPAWADAWLELADIAASQGNTQTAFSLYEQFVTEHPSLPQAADALYAAGRLAQGNGDVPMASSYFQRLGVAYPTDERAAEGLFDLAFGAYRSGDLATAETLFRGAAELPANPVPADAHLWLGKTLAAASRPEEAAAAWNAAIAADPDGYFTLRAADLLTGQVPFTRPASFTLPADPDEGRLEAETWLAERLGLGAPPLADALRDDLASDFRMVRGRELWELGLQVEAKQDFEEVRRSFEGDALASYQLAIYFREIGLYRSSVLAARTVLRLVDTRPQDAPGFLARLQYPTYFSDLVLDYSGRYGLDPLFVFSLIWQESIFEGFAVSTASAQGLMQIWPPTGEDIAAALAWPEYTPADLQRPLVSIAFGTWLLQDEFKRLGGNPSAVLVAYNAGSGRALSYLEQAGGDYDIYFELIELSEPQLYVERIYEHYAVYRALYGTDG